MPKFVPGIQLSKLFYEKEVLPVLNKHFPNLQHSAGIIGWGSEVLGFDNERSRDHHWGPRVLLFVKERDYSNLKVRIHRTLSNNLPIQFMGYSTNFSKPEPNGVRHPCRVRSGPVDHMVDIYTVKQFYKARLGFDP